MQGRNSNNLTNTLIVEVQQDIKGRPVIECRSEVFGTLAGYS
jgi:hypothetical protein